MAPTKRRKFATRGGKGNAEDQYLFAIVTDCTIEPNGPFPADAKAALNG
jgi:hypothetical protein